MNIKNRPPAFIIGMALFAMFFGSGNLIYPLYIGSVSQGAWIPATLGFLIAAVLLPFLGVMAMVLYRGSYDDFFNTIGKRKGFLLSIILLTVWIPLGSAPRCMTLAYASINSYFTHAPPGWLFALAYSVLVFYVVSKKVGVLDILGKFITPLLLGCIAVISVKAFMGVSQAPSIPETDSSFFLNGLLEGYNTMDLIASFFFSASVIHMLTQAGGEIRQSLSLVLKSSIIGIAILAVVYISLIAASAFYAEALALVPKDRQLAHLAQIILGPTWSIVAIGAIILACFSTSIALIIAYTDFLHEEIFKAKQHPNLSITLTILASFVMSLFGLEGITYITAPILKVCYPLLLVLILFNIGKYYFQKRQNVSERSVLS